MPGGGQNGAVTLPSQPSHGIARPAVGAEAVGPGRPSAIGYWIGGAVIVVGVIAAVIWFAVAIGGIVGAVSDYPRFSAPGSRDVTLDPGTYKVFVEYPGASSAAFSQVLDPTVTVANLQGRRIIVLPDSSETYSWNGHEGHSIGRFTVSEAGIYTVRASDPSGESNLTPSYRSMQVAVGKGLTASALAPIFGAVAVGGLSVLIGLVLIIVTGVRRTRWKRSQTPGPPRGYGAAPGRAGRALRGRGRVRRSGLLWRAGSVRCAAAGWSLWRAAPLWCAASVWCAAARAGSVWHAAPVWCAAACAGSLWHAGSLWCAAACGGSPWCAAPVWCAAGGRGPRLVAATVATR